MRCFVLVALALTMGCACGEADDDGDSCAQAFAPDPSLRLVTLSAAERWSKAMGCAITVEEPGTPVVLAASIPRPDGSDAPGATSADRRLVRINARQGVKGPVVIHELAHALGMDGEHALDNVIDAAALAEVCSKRACTAFMPEAP